MIKKGCVHMGNKNTGKKYIEDITPVAQLKI
jgi:hypothetical protein